MPSLGLSLCLVALIRLTAAAQAPIKPQPLAGAAAPWLSAIAAVSRWSSTPAGLSALGGDAAWRSFPAPAAAPLAVGLEELQEPGLARKLEAIASLPPAEQARLAGRLSAARELAGQALLRMVAQDPDGGDETASALEGRLKSAQTARASLAQIEATGFFGQAAVSARSAADASLSRLRALWASTSLLKEESFRHYLERTHEDLIRADRDLFLLKMNKAAESPFTFFRGFPGLLYSQIAQRPEAAALKKTPELMLHGDPHVENTEIAALRGRRAPQFNDFDDADRAPAALDLARMLVGTFLSGKNGAELFEAARRAYHESLRLSFPAWVKTLEREKSVSEAESQDRHWPKHAGRKVQDQDEAGRALRLAGLDAKHWEVFDRRGAGISSIGVRRYMFLSREHGHVFELKELRAPALGGFGHKTPAWTNRERVQAAYDMLRQLPAQTKVLSENGTAWLLHRRQARELGLDLSHPKSAARVIGGLLGQAHKSQGVSLEKLEAAARLVSLEMVGSLAESFKAFRTELRRLLALPDFPN